MSLVVGNWKMHLNVAESSLLLERLVSSINHSENEIVLCPSYPALYSLFAALKEKNLTQLFALGAQDIFYEDEGAYTGEVSGLQIRDLVDYVIVGHSERRIHFGERDKAIAAKLSAALRHELTPILCVGETLSERDDHQTKQVIADQLTVDMSDVSGADIEHIVIAYEPVWAIGTGKFATDSQAAEVIDFIAEYVRSQFGTKVRVIYGGSVTDENAASYLKLQNCDGLLVGGASLNYEKFAKIASS